MGQLNWIRYVTNNKLQVSSNTTSIQRDDDEESVCFVGVMGLEEVIARKRQKAEVDGEVVNVDDNVQDGKTPAKKQRIG